MARIRGVTLEGIIMSDSLRPVTSSGGAAEHPPDGRADVRDRRVGVDDQHELAGVPHERAQARLALAAHEVLAERGALECERGLVGERPEHGADGRRDARPLDPDQPDQHIVCDERDQKPEVRVDGVSCKELVSGPARRSRRSPNAGRLLRHARGDQRQVIAVLAELPEHDDVVGPGQLDRCDQRRLVDRKPVRGGDERGADRSERVCPVAVSVCGARDVGQAHDDDQDDQERRLGEQALALARSPRSSANTQTRVPRPIAIMSPSTTRVVVSPGKRRRIRARSSAIQRRRCGAAAVPLTCTSPLVVAKITSLTLQRSTPLPSGAGTGAGAGARPRRSSPAPASARIRRGSRATRRRASSTRRCPGSRP